MAVDRKVPFEEFNPRAETTKARRRLPHWQQSEVSYFVTFRLADSLPQPLLRQWRDERAIWLKFHPLPWLKNEQKQYEERFDRRFQEWLDAGMGRCCLRHPDVRREFEQCLLHFDGTRYVVDSYVVMPNHVHLVIRPLEGWRLSALLKQIKGVSAKNCNEALNQKGNFWMDESFDHIIRNSTELVKFRHYIADNPAKAGLDRHEYSLDLRNILVCD